MPGSAAPPPNGKWRPSKRSHSQRPPTPSIRLHDEAGCHNDPASAVPADRPMMSTISNTFADYNIDLEEEEEESTATNSSTDDDDDDDGEAYVIQVKPLPKIRLDLCPAPREEDEYRDQNRRKKKSRRRSSANKSSPRNMSKEGQCGSANDVETKPALDPSFTSTTVTDKAGNDGGVLDATEATEALLLRRQNDQQSPRTPVDKMEHAEKAKAADHAMVDADGFPVPTVPDDNESNGSKTKKNASPEMAPMFAPSPPLALALHQGTASHPSGVGGDNSGDIGTCSLPNSNVAIASSVEYKNAEEQPNAPPSPDSTADTASITPKTHHRKNRQAHDLKPRQASPSSRKEARQDDRSRRRPDCKANKKVDEEQRNIEDEEEFSSPIFDFLLTICGDVSSFVSEGCMGAQKQNGNDQQNAKAMKQSGGRAEINGGQYDLDHFKW